MTTFPNSPKLMKGAIVRGDPDTVAVQRIISPQYNCGSTPVRLEHRQVTTVKEPMLITHSNFTQTPALLARGGTGAMKGLTL